MFITKIFGKIPLFGLGETIEDAIGNAMNNAAYSINKLFAATGEWCVEISNTALNAYSKLVMAGVNLVSQDVDNNMFSDFWSVINLLVRVLGVIASTLIVLFYVITLTNDAWETRHEFSVWDYAKNFVKLMVAVVLINNAMKIINLIFNIGARLSLVPLLGVKGFSSDLSNFSLSLSEAKANRIEKGITGVKGLFIFIVFIIAALVVIACGVIIVVEVYKRLFKLYILIPFSTLSFSTFTLEAWKGQEVFSGYLKSCIAASLEAVVITLAIGFSFVLIQSEKTMNELFPIDETETTMTVKINNEDEMKYCGFITSGDNMSITSAVNMFKHFDDLGEENISADVKNALKEATEYSYYEVEFSDGKVVESQADLYKYIGSGSDDNFNYPVTVRGYKPLSWGGAMFYMLQFLFPCVLCGGAVKEASYLANIALGKG